MSAEPVFVIEAESAEDEAAIDVVMRAAFADNEAVADMVGAIRRSPQYEPELALVARSFGEVVGFVMISHVDLVEANGVRHDALTLSPVAVRADHERLGLGTRLIRAALMAADERTRLPRLVTLEGSPRFYGRLGFEFAPDFGVTFDLPEWAPPAAAQLYRLSEYNPAVRGKVVYPPAFALADG